MKVTFDGYNAFVITEGEKRLAIDPGGKFLYWLRMTTLIPKAMWPQITHIFVTHGDPDHYWHADRLAKVSGAPMIFNEAPSQKSYPLDPKNAWGGALWVLSSKSRVEPSSTWGIPYSTRKNGKACQVRTCS